MKPIASSSDHGINGMAYAFFGSAARIVTAARFISGYKRIKQGIPASARVVDSRGFALVATLSLMIILTLVAVALLSLSAISLRSSSQAKAEAEARANARLALAFALGELQKAMGSDQRISASGDIIDPDPAKIKHPRWTGVWDSWKAGPTASGGDEKSEQNTISTATNKGMAPTYQVQRKDHFRSWLLSLNPTEAQSVTSPIDVSINGSSMPDSAATAVELVGKGSVGSSADPKDLVSARLLAIKSTSGTSNAGRYGWWVGDESQKARVMDDSYLAASSSSLKMSDKIFRLQAPAAPGTTKIKGLGLENITNDGQLDALPSLQSIDLVKGVTGSPAEKFHSITPFSYQVLADVREGGLKRDLSAILERKIDPEEVFVMTTRPGMEFKWASSIKQGGDDFMLYRFDNMVTSDVGNPTGQASVPLQDLAAYYQTYDHYRRDWKGGLQYSSRDSSPPNNQLTGGVMVSNPDYGDTTADYDKYLRQHSALYRSPVPVKLEIVLHYVCEPITPGSTTSGGDQYKLRIGFSPAITLWNPFNVPLVMNTGDPERASIMIREHPMNLELAFGKSTSLNGPLTGPPKIYNLNQVTNTQQGELYTMFIAGKTPAVFQPGETKVFALQYASETNATLGSSYIDFALRGRVGNRYPEPFIPELELVPGWNPEKFCRPSILVGGSRQSEETVLTFKDGDYISCTIKNAGGNTFNTDFTQKSRHGRDQPGVMWHYRSWRIGGRLTRGNNGAQYKNDITYMGFPDPGSTVSSMIRPRPINLPRREARKLIDAMGVAADPRDDLPSGFFYYGMKAAVETHESENASPPAGGSGRRFPSRPFLHSTAMAPPIFDDYRGDSLYNYGWNWFFMPLDNILDAPISISRNSQGYFGGGYTRESGATNVVQQHLPITPPISIASLSHAMLGGFSLSTEAPAAGYNGLQDPWNTDAFRRVTAIGFGGLAPRTLQAIGNSYAHPNIPADKAYTTWDRYYTQQSGSPRLTQDPFADHSYLANKALWDEYFFSSITPRPRDVAIFEQGSSRDVGDVAKKFFFEGEKLPNRRIVPGDSGLDSKTLNTLISDYSKFRDGFADKIAAHLMVEGAFNINSTSETAWKALFTSLKGKPVSYLDKDRSLTPRLRLREETPTGVPVGAGQLPNGQSYKNSSSDPSDPEQWTDWRELTDDEIEKLAKAMVKQVKLRGPFLSLSEFVNRRLDSRNKELSLKGALQAAIDDPDVPINKDFRNNSLREFSKTEKSFVNAKFPEALDGPVAYGSSAYVDQADILRNFAEQLTPRGDTFLIRTYGDSLDAQGKVQARAWCEAVVQRTTEYVDPIDEPHIKQSALVSQANKIHGRKFSIVQFRWLDPSEI